MEITGVETVQFAYESRVTSDEKGHAHPGEPHEATRTLTRITTDEGVEGYGMGGTPAACDIAENYLLGADPFDREALWQQLYRTQRLNLGTLTDSALAAIDVALWDLAGKALGKPVYKLLGAARDSVPAYASTMVGDDDPDGLGTPEAYADFASDLVDEGFQAIKLHGWMPPYSADPERDLAACAAVRDAVGPDVDLMLDSHHYYSRTEAKTLGEGLSDLDYRWFEEPMDEHSMSAYAWLTDEVDVPVIGPETAEGKHQTRAEWIKRDVADIIRAGTHDLGGITPAMKTVNLCESFKIECELHGAGLANLHVLGATELGDYFEYGLLHPDYDYESSRPWLTDPPLPDENGVMHIPDDPGIGWNLDWDFIEANRV
ncbi:MAG: enolase C-terminal domain-like protein [Halobacteriaceae archaeon]